MRIKIKRATFLLNGRTNVWTTPALISYIGQCLYGTPLEELQRWRSLRKEIQSLTLAEAWLSLVEELRMDKSWRSILNILKM